MVRHNSLSIFREQLPDQLTIKNAIINIIMKLELIIDASSTEWHKLTHFLETANTEMGIYIFALKDISRLEHEHLLLQQTWFAIGGDIFTNQVSWFAKTKPGVFWAKSNYNDEWTQCTDIVFHHHIRLKILLCKTVGKMSTVTVSKNGQQYHLLLPSNPATHQ